MIKKTDKKIEETEKDTTQEIEKKDTITISRDVFDRMQQDIQMLKETSDKTRTSVWMQRHKEDLAKKVMIRQFNGKVILGWRTLKNDVNYNPERKVWVEDQVVELMDENGQKIETTYKNFVDNYVNINCEQIGTIEEGGQLILKLRRMDTGDEYNIGVAFVN